VTRKKAEEISTRRLWFAPGIGRSTLKDRPPSAHFFFEQHFSYFGSAVHFEFEGSLTFFPALMDFCDHS
jgi:hypothetical protein